MLTERYKLAINEILQTNKSSPAPAILNVALLQAQFAMDAGWTLCLRRATPPSHPRGELLLVGTLWGGGAKEICGRPVFRQPIFADSHSIFYNSEQLFCLARTSFRTFSRFRLVYEK